MKINPKLAKDYIYFLTGKMANFNRAPIGCFLKIYMNGQILIQIKRNVVSEHFINDANQLPGTMT